MTRSPASTPRERSTLPMRQTPSWSCAKVSDQLRPFATIFSARPCCRWESTKGPQMLKLSGKEMRAGVTLRSTATVCGPMIALSKCDVTVEVGTALLELLALSGPADLTLVDDVVALRKRQQRAQILVHHQNGDARGGNA